MRALNVMCLVYFLISTDSSNLLAAQETSPRNQLSLDASYLREGSAMLTGKVLINSWTSARAWYSRYRIRSLRCRTDTASRAP